ncbi:MAG: sialidase family protein, partial [Nitrososphaerales archaeon]
MKRVTAISLGVVLLAAAANVRLEVVSGFEGVTNVSNTNVQGSLLFYEIAVSDSNVYVVWQDCPVGQNPRSCAWEVFFARSTDNGASFSDPINVSKTAGSSNYAEIAVSGSNVYVMWREKEGSGSEIFFARSTDNGASFLDPINVSKTTALATEMAASGSNVYVVWNEQIESNNIEVFFARSTDNGASFGDAINVGNTSSPGELNIAISGSNVYVIWTHCPVGENPIFCPSEIFLARSTDGGASFSDPINVSNTAGTSDYAEIAVSGSNVYVMWWQVALARANIFFARSTDNGASFGDPISVSETTEVGTSPEMAVSGSNVYLVWNQQNRKSMFSRSTDEGASFSDPITVSNTDRTSTWELIAASGSNVFVAGLQNIEPGFRVAEVEIFFARSTDNGASFSDLIIVSNTAGAFAPLITASGSNVYLTWEDQTSGKKKILLKSEVAPIVSEAPEVPKPTEAQAADISVAMKHKKKVSLVAVKNNSDEEVFGVQMKIDDGNIRFVKARGWDRDRIDQQTVVVQTDDRPIKPGQSLIILMIVDNKA